MGTNQFNILDKIIAYLRLGQIKKYFSPDDIVLDFGCGKQCFLLQNINLYINKGIGLDYDADNQKIKKNIEIKKFRFETKLPFPDKTFTKIAMLAVLEHLDLNLISPLFSEFKRVLKPKGQVILTSPTPKSKKIMEFLAFKLGIVSKLEIGDHKKYYSKKDLESIGRKHKLLLKDYKTFQFGLNSLCVLSKN